MKRILTSALMILLTIGAANAQTTKTEQKEGPKKEHRSHYQHLNLTEAQKAKLAELRARHKAEREASKEDKKALMQRHRAEMEAVLTPEQKAEIAKKRAERSTSFQKGKGFKKEGRKQGKMARSGGEGRSEAMAKHLNLSTDQQAKLKEAQTAFRSQMQSVRTDKALNEEQKRAKVKELAQQHRTQLQSILTKEQQEKVQQMRKEHPVRNAK